MDGLKQGGGGVVGLSRGNSDAPCSFGGTFWETIFLAEVYLIFVFHFWFFLVDCYIYLIFVFHFWFFLVDCYMVHCLSFASFA
jgi:hypothetical protein